MDDRSPEDVFLDADESEGWIPVLDVGLDRGDHRGEWFSIRRSMFMERTIGGSVFQVLGEDLACFLENNVVHRILRMTEEDPR